MQVLNVNAGAGGGYTPLHNACVRDHLDMVKLLLNAGADVNAKNIHGNTPLHPACRHKFSMDIVKLLVDAGADLKATNLDGETPLMYATSEKFDFKLNEFLRLIERTKSGVSASRDESKRHHQDHSIGA